MDASSGRRVGRAFCLTRTRATLLSGNGYGNGLRTGHYAGCGRRGRSSIAFTFHVQFRRVFCFRLHAWAGCCDVYQRYHSGRLFGVPGTSASQATVLDGHSMAKNGEAGRALSAAYAASLIGGLWGAFLLWFNDPGATTDFNEHQFSRVTCIFNLRPLDGVRPVRIYALAWAVHGGIRDLYQWLRGSTDRAGTLDIRYVVSGR